MCTNKILNTSYTAKTQYYEKNTVVPLYMYEIMN
jgi:hypothetical protein